MGQARALYPAAAACEPCQLTIGRALRREPVLEALEGRQLLTASLQSIAPITVPALQGYTVPLLAASGDTDPQTFTVSSSNPDIGVSIAQGPFWTIGVSSASSCELV